jgi:hypothetical protein
MKFIIAMDDVFVPEVLERHEGTEADARRVLSQWMNDDDRIVKERLENGMVLLSIVDENGQDVSDIFAMLKEGM